MSSIFDPMPGVETVREQMQELAHKYSEISERLLKGEYVPDVPWQDKRFHQVFSSRVRNLQAAAARGYAFTTTAEHLVKLLKAAL
jgi:hypothetical protein